MNFDLESAVPDFNLFRPIVNSFSPPVHLSGAGMLGGLTIIVPTVAVIPGGPKATTPMNFREGILTSYIYGVQAKALALWNEAEAFRKTTEQLLGVAAAFNALEGLAHVMVDYARVHANGPEVIGKAKTVEDAAGKLHAKAMDSLGKDLPSYGNVDPSAVERLERLSGELERMLRDGVMDGGGIDIKPVLGDYWADPAIPLARKMEFVRDFELMLVPPVEIMMRTPGHEKAAKLANDSFEQPDLSVWGVVVKLMSQAAQGSTQTLGQMGPGPDPLVIALIKCYMTRIALKATDVSLIDEIEKHLARLASLGMRFKGDKQAEFYRLYKESNISQYKHLSAQKRLAEMNENYRRRQIKTSPQERSAAQSACSSARKAEKANVDKLKDFLFRETRSESTYEAIHAGVALNGVLTILSIFQIIAAWESLSSDEESNRWKTGKGLADLASGTVGMGLGAIYTVNQVYLNAGKTQGWLQKLNEVMSAGKALKFISAGIAVLGIVSGVCSMVLAGEEEDRKEFWMGAAQTTSSILLLVGALAFVPWAVALGALIAIALAVVEIAEAVSEGLKPESEKAFRHLFERMEKRKIATTDGKRKPVLELLKCQSEYAQLKSAVEEMDWFPLMKDEKNPSEEKGIRDSLSKVGFDHETICTILETPQRLRVQDAFMHAPI